MNDEMPRCVRCRVNDADPFGALCDDCLWRKHCLSWPMLLRAVGIVIGSVLAVALLGYALSLVSRWLA